MTIEQVPADPSNYTKGRLKTAIDRIVVHVMDGSLAGTDAWFQNPKSNVSAHYGIGEDGEVHQYVDEADAAWHAGDWGVNLRSVGIEHEGRQPAKNPPYWVPSSKQWDASVWLCAAVCERHNIVPSAETILRHSAVNPDHALCPGPGFDLDSYIARVREAMNKPVRLFDPRTNHQVGTGTLVAGTDKVYIAHLDS